MAWLTVAATGLLIVASGLYPRNLTGDPRLPSNPTGIRGAEDTLDTLAPLALVLFLVAGLASLQSVAVRFERAKGVERQQLKWLSYAAVLFGVAVLFGLLVTLIWGSTALTRW